MTFTLRGQGRFRDLVVTRAPETKRIWRSPADSDIEIAVIPYEVWSGELWALLCEELERQGQRQARGKK